MNSNLKSYFLLLQWQLLRMKVILPFFAVLQVMIGIGTIIGLSFFMADIDNTANSFNM